MSACGGVRTARNIWADGRAGRTKPPHSRAALTDSISTGASAPREQRQPQPPHDSELRHVIRGGHTGGVAERTSLSG
eukprot:2681543-Prymnesium_polylepis.2